MSQLLYVTINVSDAWSRNTDTDTTHRHLHTQTKTHTSAAGSQKIWQPLPAHQHQAYDKLLFLHRNIPSFHFSPYTICFKHPLGLFVFMKQHLSHRLCTNILEQSFLPAHDYVIPEIAGMLSRCEVVHYAAVCVSTLV